jgi:hypothetical protein
LLNEELSLKSGIGGQHAHGTDPRLYDEPSFGIGSFGSTRSAQLRGKFYQAAMHSQSERSTLHGR